MSKQMIIADQLADYEIKEAAVIVAALAFCIALGGVVAAATVLCGWRGVRKVSTEWLRGRVTIYCR